MFLSLILDPGLTLYSAMLKDQHKFPPGGGGGVLQEFLGGVKLILLPYTRLNSQNPPTPAYPRVAVFQRLLRSPTRSSENKTDLIFSHFWVAIPGFPSLD